MRWLLIFALLAAPVFADTTAEIVSRQEIERKDGTWERVKMTVTLDDGTKRSYWPYVKQGTQTDKQLTDNAITVVDADVAAEAEAEENQPIPKEEVDAVIAELEKDGKLPAGVDTWEEAVTEANKVVAVGPGP